MCIVDHDKLAPMDDASGTAKNVLRNHKRKNRGENGCAKNYIGMAVTTIGREAENLIPYHVVKTMDAYQNY